MSRVTKDYVNSLGPIRRSNVHYQGVTFATILILKDGRIAEPRGDGHFNLYDSTKQYQSVMKEYIEFIIRPDISKHCQVSH